MTIPRSAGERIRAGLLGLAGASCAGVAVELALSRHWTKATQLVAWGALAVLASSVVTLARSPGLRAVRAVRLGCGLVLVASVVGVVLHVWGNYEAGPLDAVYGERWESMPGLERWWAALSQRVGPSPVMVPLLLVQVAAMVWLSARPTAEGAPPSNAPSRTAA